MVSVDNPRILVIDDDEIVIALVSQCLESAGFAVTASLDGEEGLSQAVGGRPDLVILDIMMPGMSGLDVMLEMRSEPATRDIPILFLTNVDDEATIVKGLRGAEDYMVKPFKPLELEMRVRNILDRVMEISSETERGASLMRLPIKVGGDTFLLPLREIFFVEASGKYCQIYTRKRGFLADYSIGDIEKKLAGYGFMRIHRSHIVNLANILKVTRRESRRITIVMNDDSRTELNVSDQYAPELKSRLGIKQ